MVGANVNVIPTCPTPTASQIWEYCTLSSQNPKKNVSLPSFQPLLEAIHTIRRSKKNLSLSNPIFNLASIEGVSLGMTRFFVSTSVYLISLQNGEICFPRFRRESLREGPEEMAEVKVSDVIRIDKMFSGVTDEEVST